MNTFDYDYNYDLPEDEYHGGNLVCEVLESHFYFYGSWWMIPILQVLAPFVLMTICYCFVGGCSLCWDDLCKCETFQWFERRGLTGLNVFQLVAGEGPFWFWTIYLILVFTQNCGWDTESGVEPMFWTSIIFIPLFYILNFCLYFSHDERQAISNQTNPDGFHKYFTKATEMSPGVSIQGKSYHYIYHDRMRTARNRTKVTSFEGDEEFKFSKWLDISEHPDIVFDKTHINVVKFSYEAIPGDEYTKHELDTFHQNFKSYVKDLDELSGKFHYKTKTFQGYDEETYEIRFEERRDDDPPSYVIGVCEQDYKAPWYSNTYIMFILNCLCVSFFLRVLVSSRCRNHSFTIRKKFFSDPRKPVTDYNFILNPTLPHTGLGREGMPLVSSTTGQRKYVRDDQPQIVYKPYQPEPESSQEGENKLISYFDDITKLNVQNI